MPKIVLSRDEALEILNGGDIVEDKILGNSRWGIQHRIVFKRDGKFYRADYQVGATECQDEFPWGYDEEVQCTEVEPVTVPKVVYRDVKDG